MSDYKINLLIELSNGINENNLTMQQIQNQWYKYLRLVLREDWHFNKSAIESVIKWGKEGGHNWERLHWENKDYKEYLKQFSNDIYYCCDRMGSLDRIFRCHWFFNASLDNYDRVNKLNLWKYS